MSNTPYSRKDHLAYYQLLDGAFALAADGEGDYVLAKPKPSPHNCLMRYLIVPALAFAVSGAAAAPAENLRTANDFLRDYASASSDQRNLHKIFVQGMIEGIGWSNAYVEAVRKEKGLYCPPPKLALTAEQVIEILRRAVSQDSKFGSHPMAAAVLYSLQNVFPCK